SQEPQYITKEQVYRLLMYYTKKDRGDEGYPFVTPETQFGTTFIHALLDEYKYPRSRIFRRPEELKVGAPSMPKWGFATVGGQGQSKMNAVAALVELLENRQRIIRSERIVSQAYHFIRKSDRVVEAQTKGKGKATSKDDGIYACCIEAYAEVYSPRPVGVTFRGGNGGKLYQGDVAKADSRHIRPDE